MMLSINSSKRLDGDYLKINKKRIVNSISRNIKSKFYACGIQVLNPKKLIKILKRLIIFMICGDN